MTSILTNSGAIVALQTLMSTNRSIVIAQNQVSTGRNVNTAAEGSAIWAVTKVMESDASTFRVIRDGLNVAAQVVSIAVGGAGDVIESLKEIKNRLVSARQPEGDAVKSLAEIKQTYIEKIRAVISSRQFNGVNLLAKGGTGTDSTTYKVLSSLDRELGKAETSVSGIDVETADFSTGVLLPLDNIFTYKGDATVADDGSVTGGTPLTADHVYVGATEEKLAPEVVDALISAVEVIIDTAIKKTSTLGNHQNHIESQADVANKLADSLAIGIGALVDTNMEEASARLKALQTQQQLGVQAMSIANQTPGVVLALFR